MTISRWAETRRLAYFGSRSLLALTTLVWLGGCAVEPPAEESVAQASWALTALDVFGFETSGAWSTTTAGAVLSQSTTRSQGSYSLQLKPSSGNGYTPLASVALSNLTRVSPTLAVDIMLPTTQVNPNWYGTSQAYLNSPKLGIYSAFLGQVELTGKPLNVWNTITFPLSNEQVTKLLSSGYSDLTITIVVNVQVPTTGLYRVDNLRFLPVTGTGCSGKPNGTACDDGNACTASESCQNNVCKALTTVTCTATDQCHTAGTCTPSTGLCSNPAKPNGAVCNDDNACTQTDTCQAGLCTGANPVVCPAPDQCHTAGTCTPSTGQCTNPAKPNGSVCNDGNACTEADTCQSGNCSGANPVVCSAPDQCHTAGTCDASTGSCVGAGPLTCQPLDECHTAGTCDPTSGCSNPVAPDGTPCSQGGSMCLSGTCTATPAGVCIVRDNVTNMPNASDPDVAVGYVKKTIPGISDYDGLYAACTNEIYQDLLAQHCAVSAYPVQAGIGTFFPDGTPASSGCGAIGCDKLYCPVSGVCIVRDNVTNMPNYYDPDLALGYAKKSMLGVTGYDATYAVCTNEIYQDLVAKHCAVSDTPVQAGVATFFADGSPYENGCGAIGCEKIYCPMRAVCIVRDNVTDLPNYNAPDIGPGYAKQTVTGIYSDDELLAACTDTIMQNLFAAHCAYTGSDIQAGVATFFLDGSPRSTGCAASGCDRWVCP